ncbi:hypothetical protein NPIL_40001 [Nephila pilipes]|uniref:Uncharacterized protein n=1 Tax=Nephila pilipes TaxID=299642 RepID=A0A8X6U882_NEPPI|nr:hypothetical protein NPIL_40001 [Nephila pilipes]
MCILTVFPRHLPVLILSYNLKSNSPHNHEILLRSLASNVRCSPDSSVGGNESERQREKTDGQQPHHFGTSSGYSGPFDGRIAESSGKLSWKIVFTCFL